MGRSRSRSRSRERDRHRDSRDRRQDDSRDKDRHRDRDRGRDRWVIAKAGGWILHVCGGGGAQAWCYSRIEHDCHDGIIIGA